MRFLTLLLCTLAPFATYGQLSIDDAGATYIIDFDNTVDGVNNDVYDGSGLDPNPGPGQLDGDAWEIIGLSDGDHNFGNSSTGNDHTRGTSAGGVNDGGLYAFNVGSGNYAFGFQPSDADLTPGYITLKVTNNTGDYIHAIDLSYEIYEFNNEDRSTAIGLYWSLDNSNFWPVTSLDFISEESAAASPSWEQHERSITLKLLVPTGSDFYIRWETDDYGGSGSRDELALDDIEISAQTTAESDPFMITEFLPDPEEDQNGATLNDLDGEWIEVYNNISAQIQLQGLKLMDDAGNEEIISSSVIINSGGLALLARNDEPSENGGIAFAEFDYDGNVSLNNNGDVFGLYFPINNIVIDEIDYNTWSPIPSGASWYFHGSPSQDNNDPSFWSVSTSRELRYTSSGPPGDLGSPGTNGSGQLLPLWITTLDGTYQNGEVQLAWETEQAEGIDKFEVELSRNGATFQKIGEVPADPGSLNYQFAKSYDFSETAYARIRQVDKAGTFFYTDMIVLKPAPTESLEVYPNPATNYLHMSAEADLAGAAYQIVDASGRLLRSGRLTAHPIDVSELPSGLYHLRVAGTQQIFNNTFLKH